jgi:hypothetical protein
MNAGKGNGSKMNESRSAQSSSDPPSRDWLKKQSSGHNRILSDL